MYKFIVCIFLLAIASCQSNPSKPLMPITLENQSRETLEFTGRGAAAGMMMAGSMGAMGIAIGVAIDEGIAKDLHRSAAEGGLDVSYEFQQALAANGYQIQSSSSAALVIQHIGFRAAGDLITPWVECVYRINGEDNVLKYGDIAGDAKLTEDLNVLKAEPKLAAQMLRNAIAITVAELTTKNKPLID